MRRRRSVRVALVALPTAIALSLVACGGSNGTNVVPLAEQAACKSLTPAALGGPMPEGDTVVIRWLGTSNFEVAYHGKIILMDTYYDRPARTRSVGFTVDQVKKADAILIGHAHSDHISDLAAVASQTGAPVYGSAITATEALALGVPPAQVTTVKGDNTEKIVVGDINIQPTHIIHSTIEPGLIPALSNLYAVDSLGPLTPEQIANNAQHLQQGFPRSEPGCSGHNRLHNDAGQRLQDCLV